MYVLLRSAGVCACACMVSVYMCSDIERQRGERTCIDKAIMEMETKQRGPHAMFLNNCVIHCSFNGREGSWACGCIESWG